MKRFKRVYIEITNICNLSCEFCPKTSRKPAYMSLELFASILQQIKDYTDHIYLHVLGEPLLHPHIDNILDISYNNGLKVNITTNGTLIRKTKDKILSKPALRQVNFSLHSFDANSLDFSIDDYLGNIFSFVKEATSISDLLVSMRLWNLQELNNDKEINRHILERIEAEFKLDFKIEEKLLPGHGITIAHHVFLSQSSRFSWPIEKKGEELDRGFCHALRDQIAILADGTVVPCCLDGEGIINLGNIKDTLFTNIIDDTRAKNLYNGFSNRKVVESLCKTCSYRRRFNK